MIAALGVTLLVLIVIVGITAVLLVQRQHTSRTSAPSSGPTTQSPSASTPAAQPAPSASATTSATAPPATGLPGLTPFLGEWRAGQSGVIRINSDGTGRWAYPDNSSCPPDTPRAGCGISGSADFTLTSVANGTASGSVTASTNPTYAAVGQPITIVQGTGSQGRGVVLAVTVGKMQGWSFCNDTSPHWCAGG